jgi:ubiquinone/menaquinone biosynthesis C-methylase UbiE
MAESRINYNSWHRQHATEDDITTSWHTFVKKSLIRHDVEGKIVLEIGCGRGGFSNYLATLAPTQVFACDYSASAIEIAKQKYTHELITWKQENIMSLGFKDETFDAAISCETIEHVPDAEKAIQELYRVIKPGGRLFLTCPNYFNLFGVWCAYRWMIGKPFTEGGQPFVNYVLMPNVYRWIRSAGFKVEHFSSSELILPARTPKHFYDHGTPWWFRIFGSRTFYILNK